ncbi:MAG: hypothetical protein GMKNLPBB_00721 [Myxococcota bacterium]|nr:hypothetical protein [Myxococcota bacterium]
MSPRPYCSARPRWMFLLLVSAAWFVLSACEKKQEAPAPGAAPAQQGTGLVEGLDKVDVKSIAQRYVKAINTRNYAAFRDLLPMSMREKFTQAQFDEEMKNYEEFYFEGVPLEKIQLIGDPQWTDNTHVQFKIGLDKQALSINLEKIDGTWAWTSFDGNQEESGDSPQALAKAVFEQIRQDDASAYENGLPEAAKKGFSADNFRKWLDNWKKAFFPTGTEGAKVESLRDLGDGNWLAFVGGGRAPAPLLLAQADKSMVIVHHYRPAAELGEWLDYGNKLVKVLIKKDDKGFRKMLPKEMAKQKEEAAELFNNVLTELGEVTGGTVETGVALTEEIAAVQIPAKGGSHTLLVVKQQKNFVPLIPPPEAPAAAPPSDENGKEAPANGTAGEKKPEEAPKPAEEKK